MADREVIVIKNDSNGLGLAGLVFSVLGWFTCGLLCIPGAVLSFFGLFSSGPKGTAIAGLIVGFPGVLFFATIGAGILAGIAGIGPAVNAARETARARITAEQSTYQAEEMPEVLQPTLAETAEPTTIEDSVEVDMPTPLATPEPQLTMDPVDPEPAMPDELKPAAEEPDFREFSDASGKFRIRAQFLGVADGKAKLKKEDGTEIEVALEKLSDNDRAYIDLLPYQ